MSKVTTREQFTKEHPYLKVEEVSHYFGMKKYLVRSLLSTGAIKGSRDPRHRRWYVRTDSVFDYLEKYEPKESKLINA